tara:strand:- start:16707 stop:17714 length:1008 start_codon:yes stop_codon:yes gene_type:complete
MNILVTGGLGYLGSHAVVELIKQNYRVVILDNLSNSRRKNLIVLENLCDQKIDFYEADIRDEKNLNKIFSDNNISGIMHFAGLKSVKKSDLEKKEYFDVNVNGTRNLIETFNETNNKKFFIFSSSACVYGSPNYLPYDENHELRPENYYGQTKLQTEQLLENTFKNHKDWKIIILRYFNPVGSHHSYLIGDDPLGKPENLMPNILRAVNSEKKGLKIFGSDHDTFDGTPVRDFIHVDDLINGHVLALNFLKKSKKDIFEIFNLGKGEGLSVLQLIKAFEDTNEVKVSFEFAGKRKGDLPIYFSSAKKINKKLGWEPKLSAKDMCKSSWEFHKNNK